MSSCTCMRQHDEAVRRTSNSGDFAKSSHGWVQQSIPSTYGLRFKVGGVGGSAIIGLLTEKAHPQPPCVTKPNQAVQSIRLHPASKRFRDEQLHLHETAQIYPYVIVQTVRFCGCCRVFMHTLMHFSRFCVVCIKV